MFVYICLQIHINMKSERIIYGLCCPFTNEVHYIGKSTQGMLRPMQHLKTSHSEKIKEWVNELNEIGHSPIVKILEYVPLEEDLDSRERWWIQKELNNNSLLLNSCLITPMLISSNLDNILKDYDYNDDAGYLIIGEVIKQNRKKTGLTQEEFAEKAGVALTVIRKIEQGKSNINLSSLLQILKMFGLMINVSKIKKI